MPGTVNGVRVSPRCKDTHECGIAVNNIVVSWQNGAPWCGTYWVSAVVKPKLEPYLEQLTDHFADKGPI